MHADEEEDPFWWTRGPALPSHSTVGFLRPAVTPPAHLTPTSSSGGGSPADSVTSSPPLIRDFRRALIGRDLPRGRSAQSSPLLDPSHAQGLLTTADATRINMYSKPPPLSIPTIVPPIPSYAMTPRMYNAHGGPGYNGPPPGMTSVAYRSFPGSGSVTSSPSPPPTMPGRECKFCKNNGETTQMYRSHSLRNPSDGRLICPVLRDHVCDMCGATGDDAHTRNYCPLNAEKKKQAIPLFLKNTRRQSDGHYRI